MSSIISNIIGIAEKIAELPLKLTENLIEGVKGIFIPDSDFISNAVDRLTGTLTSLGIVKYDMSGIFANEKPFSDFTCTIRGHKVVIVDMTFVDKALETFRPIIRGFLWLLLVLYNFNQFMGLIGQPGISIAGIIKNESKDGGTE